MTKERLDNLERRLSALETKLGSMQPEEAQRLRETRFAAILKDVAEAFDLQLKDLTGSDRTHSVAAARGLVCWIARQTTDLTFSVLGRLLGGRDHTTVRKGVSRAAQLRDADREFRDLSDRLLAAARERRRA
jgi:chromosomal replication initiator protein